MSYYSGGDGVLPKQTFFNLNDEKRTTLIEAAMKEFSRVPFAEASISNIVKDAEISRGSFYQYFEDKEDVFFYLLKEDSNRRDASLIESLKANKGDLLMTMDEMFREMLSELDNKDRQHFYRNVFTHLNYKIEKTFMNDLPNNDYENKLDLFKPLIDLSKFNIKDPNELTHIVQLIMMVMMQNLVFKFAKNLANEAVLNNYKVQMELLSHGILKK